MHYDTIALGYEKKVLHLSFVDNKDPSPNFKVKGVASLPSGLSIKLALTSAV